MILLYWNHGENERRTKQEKKEENIMKKDTSIKTASILAGMAAALSFAAFMPATAYAAGILNLVPAESQAVDTSGPRFVATPYTHYMDVSESQKVDTGGPRFVAAPSTHYMDVSESQALDTRSDTPAAAHRTGDNKITSN